MGSARGAGSALCLTALSSLPRTLRVPRNLSHPATTATCAPSERPGRPKVPES